jgi:hypothetical protein
VRKKKRERSSVRRATRKHPEVLVVCESSGVVRNAFRRAGFDAWSCDLLPADDGSEYHIQGDMFRAIRRHRRRLKMLVCHPPCTYLCSSGLHWNARDPTRGAKTEAALAVVKRLLESPVPRIALENPVGCISTRIRRASQYIQPHDFGHDASKRTGLWLKGLPNLVATERVAPRVVDGKKRWANQTDSGQNRLGPSEDRWKARSRTYEGIADAMVKQWGPVIRASSSP